MMCVIICGLLYLNYKLYTKHLETRIDCRVQLVMNRFRRTADDKVNKMNALGRSLWEGVEV